ncbi:MAG: recombinase family protein [bacterium]
MLTAAVYARFSSELQRLTSLEDQVRLCRDAAPRFGCTVPDAHVYTDAELSGATNQRPGYTNLLAAAEQRRVDLILVESQDRLWRDQAEMHTALRRLRFWNVRVIAVTTGTDLTDRTGGVLATIYGLKDELFLADLRDKTRRGMEGAIRRGRSAGGRAFGYRSEPVIEGGQVVGARRVIDPDEAAIVVRIFELYRDGRSPQAIAHLLNDEHVTPPRPVRGRGLRGWTWSTVSGSPRRALGILNNPLYDGRLVWNRSRKVLDPDTGRRVMRTRPEAEWLSVDAPDLRIVPPDLWQAVQDRRTRRRSPLTGNTRGRYTSALLSGLLVCDPCGSHYVLARPTYYGCTAHHDRGPAICANGRLARRDVIERRVLEAVFEQVFAEDMIEYVTMHVREALRRLSAPQADARRQRDCELAHARRELGNVLAAIRSGLSSPSTKALLESCERRVAELEAALAVPVIVPQVDVLPAQVERYLSDLRGTLTTDTAAARRLLGSLLEPIRLRPVGRQLVGELRGNLWFLLGGEGREVANYGAGRGI